MGRIAVALLVMVWGCGSSSETEDTRPCEQVRDHLVELQLADATHVDADAHRKAMRAALGDDFITACQTKLTAMQRGCVLDARDRVSADACTAAR